jgi:uncharacterized protein (DUF885 family)
MIREATRTAPETEADSASSSIREVDAVAERYVSECTSRYPEIATYLGVAGLDDRWSDYSPAGIAAEVAHLRSTVADLHAAVPCDQRENTAKEAMLERLSLELELHEAHILASRVSVVVGAAQTIRGTFDLMAVDTEEDWANVAARLNRVGEALGGVQETLRHEAQQGNISALRQITGTIEQINAWTGKTGQDDFFAGLVGQAPSDLPEAARSRLETAAEQARQSFSEFAGWLGSHLAPLAPRLDAVGEERYALQSRSFLGAMIDLEETYHWGFEELDRIQGEQREIARALFGTSDIKAACDALDADAERRIVGAEAFRDWMQKLADTAIGDLAGTHFDIPEPIRRLECCLAPTHEGGIYYTGPTEDFSRPGRMWWAVPEGVDSFSTWKEVTTVYHEGVPGHHLQVGQNAYRADLLNRWQRQLCFVSGHGEGWALYAERLMDDLGYLSDPGDRMGMLDAQAFRATRVVVDIGMHLQLPIPRHNPWDFHPGERWTPDLGLEFLVQTTALDLPTLTFERDRYLGWPGQAPSYKVGERIWLQARDEVRARRGSAFDLRTFHSDALNLGPLGLDALRAALARL